jgi:hypothetical protein
MTELQQTFLFYTFIYFLIKGGLYVALYVATIVIEKEAGLNHNFDAGAVSLRNNNCGC